MKQETTADYTRAIQELRNFLPGLPTKAVVADAEAALYAALSAVAPEWKHILCRWHIGQNILTEYKRKMTEDRWKLVLRQWQHIINAPSIPEFERRLEYMAGSQQGKTYGKKLMEYIRHRLRPGQREKIVSCWLDDFAHYGQTSSSRAEGGHSQLKSQLNSCRGDLFLVVKVIRSGMFAQQSRILQKIRDQKFSPPKKSRVLFGEVCGSW